MTGIAVLIGVATMVFAIGLSLSLHMVASSLGRDQQVQVDVRMAPDRTGPAVPAVIASTQGTSRFVGEGQSNITVPRIASPIPFYGYDGGSGWIGYVTISGRWFSSPGEVVAPSHLLDVTGLRLGQSFTATRGSASEQLTLVGEIFDQSGDDLLLRGSWSDVSRLDPTAAIDEYEVQLRPGTDARQYASDLEAAAGTSADARPVSSFSAETAFLLIEGVLGGLALVLAGIAAIGVFNTVILGTRERRREIAILKAIGMDPSQVVLMVVSSVAVIGLLAALVGLPVGLVMHHEILTSMAEIATNTRVPAGFYSVVGPMQLALLMIAGVAIAAAGAWMPARWAATESVSASLQAE
jgi:putative ABC transport system permease protein